MINLVRPGSQVCVPVKTVASNELRDNGGNYTILGRIALRVSTGNVANGVASRGVPVYVVSQAELDAGRFIVDQSAPVVQIVDVAAGIDRPIMGAQAQPVFIVTE